MADDNNLDPKIIERENQGALDAGVTGVEDVGSTREPVQRSEQQQQPAERAEEVVKIGSKFNDKRAEIARKFREERDSRNGEGSLEIVPSEREKTFFGEGVETRQDRIDRQREARGEPAEPIQQPAVRTLKVNGRDIQVSEEDLVKHASRALAGDDYMDIAKRARDEANTLLGELREKSRTAISGDQTQQPQAEDATTETAAILDGIDLDQLADRIQLGERGDAKAALQELATGIIQSVKGNLDRDVTEVVENRHRQSEAVKAIQEFGEANPILTTRAAQAALAIESLDIMRGAMRENGLTDDFVESLKRDYGMDEARATRYCYEQMEKLGHKLPSRKDILHMAGNSVKKQFGLTSEQRQPQPDPRIPANREARKEQITSQPRRALQTSPLERGERDRDQVRRDAVAQMRESRGRRR